MFEKEAEEYNQKVPFNPLNVEKEIRRAFQKGAEFGYNKGYHDAEEHYMNVIDSQHKFVEESKVNEWHYVKDEFPPENVPLNIITLDKNKKRRLWVGEYKGGNGKWWTGYFNHFIDVPYAWKEIVLPELKESE